MDYLDMLARLGIGSAHPGGFGATLEQLSHYPISKGSRVLEIGCGTGRTACYLAAQGCKVTAVDIRPHMLQKASKRAEIEGVHVDFLEGDACSLPLPSHQFDVVFVESVTNFVNIASALKEYARVLRAGGILYDREIIAIGNISESMKKAFSKFYKIQELFTVNQWQELFAASPFGKVNIWKPSSLNLDGLQIDLNYLDPHQEVDEDAYSDDRLWEAIKEYEEIIDSYYPYFGYAVLIGTKS